MKKILQSSLFVFVFILSLSHSNAQQDRVKLAKAATKPAAQDEIGYTKTEEKKTKNLHPSTNPDLTKRKDASKQENKDALINGNGKNKVEIDVKKSSTFRKPKTAEQLAEVDDNIEKKKNIEAPLFTDFQVTGTKEEPYENKIVSKESSSQQLVKLERVPADEFPASSANPVDQKITISPLKRKYLEVVMADLEKDIKSGQNSLVEIRAKKKEVDDLKKLLAQ